VQGRSTQQPPRTRPDPTPARHVGPRLGPSRCAVPLCLSSRARAQGTTQKISRSRPGAVPGPAEKRTAASLYDCVQAPARTSSRNRYRARSTGALSAFSLPFRFPGEPFFRSYRRCARVVPHVIASLVSLTYKKKSASIEHPSPRTCVNCALSTTEMACVRGGRATDGDVRHPQMIAHAHTERCFFAFFLEGGPPPHITRRRQRRALERNGYTFFLFLLPSLAST
jgi:hypothetical protein